MGCQSGSGSSCPAPGATPFAPDAPLPSTADRPDRNGLAWRVRMAFTSQAEQQAEQQGAERQCDAQRLEAVQFGVEVALDGFGFRHRPTPRRVHGHIKPPARALAAAESGRPAAGIWRNAGKRVAWLARARPA